MKRQSERDSSPGRAVTKRPRERERDRERDSNRREEGPPLTPSAERGTYHKPPSLGGSKHQTRSRSREREKSSSRREDRAGGDPHHRHHQHDPAVNSRVAVRAGSGQKSKGDNSRSGGVEYKTLLISNLGSQLSDELIEDGLFHEFKKFGDVSVKISHAPDLGRVAYLNFRHPEDAKEARHAKGRLVLYDRPLKVEPVYPRKRSCTPPEVGYLPIHGTYQYRQRSLSPIASSLRDQRPRHASYAIETMGLSRERERVLDYYGMYDERGRPYGYTVPEEELMPEDDQRATRNLFIGNLDHNVSESELRRAFEKYGIIEEVVIKRPSRGQGGAYAFLKFQNLDMAHRAKVAMSGRVIGRNPVKIGYGKANPTTRLWVGGLGPNTSLAALAREFDRFGSIRTIDYVKGDSFAYIQYESLDAAQAACAQMRGFPLGGPDRRLRVDFAKAEETRYPQQYQQGPLPMHYELLPDGYGRHRSLERELRIRDRTPPHLLYPERERAFPEGDWTSPAKSIDRRSILESFSRPVRSRSRERWPNEREADRSVAKPWDERRKPRSLSNDRGRVTHSPYDEKGRGKPRGSSLERSPERGRHEKRVSETGTDKDQNSTLQDNKHSEDKPRQGMYETSQLKKRDSERNHRTNENEVESKSSEVTKSETKKPTTLSEYAQTLPLAWKGVLVLKNSCFPTTMHILEGDLGILNILLKDYTAGGKISQLKIAQRLRLDQPKLDEVTRRIKQGGPSGYAVLLATQAPQGVEGGEAAPAEPGLQQRLLRNLVSYLKQKQAAGVISLPIGGPKERVNNGMLYAFPPCDFSQQYLQSALRTLGKLEEEHLVVVIVKETA
ncbi:putative RNA-binding protein 15B [Latimeria chalumnae]|uniref:Putative RNA-binding protein 15B n=1 Tax=Latimeria chalumnae TaxID=7897 RepID=H3BAF2_LATCH|nr:PREDICTED: putative RNA-binding protein 15B [Latimeria chalumnae]|eukprot:XP_005992729.1 PREDICTED: putative RNA-binding protein 15B [Latimeria chalumnae]